MYVGQTSDDMLQGVAFKLCMTYFIHLKSREQLWIKVIYTCVTICPMHMDIPMNVERDRNCVFFSMETIYRITSLTLYLLILLHSNNLIYNYLYSSICII